MKRKIVVTAFIVLMLLSPFLFSYGIPKLKLLAGNKEKKEKVVENITTQQAREMFPNSAANISEEKQYSISFTKRVIYTPKGKIVDTLGKVTLMESDLK